MQASTFIEIIEQRQGLKVACLEEIAYRMGYIDAEQLRALAEPMRKNEYGQYLLDLLENTGARSDEGRPDRASRGADHRARRCFGDDRGFFCETFHAQRYARGRHRRPLRAGQPLALGAGHAARAALPGAPRRRASWSRCCAARCFDVAVDVRRGLADASAVGRRRAVARTTAPAVGPAGLRARLLRRSASRRTSSTSAPSSTRPRPSAASPGTIRPSAFPGR